MGGCWGAMPKASVLSETSSRADTAIVIISRAAPAPHRKSQAPSRRPPFSSERPRLERRRFEFERRQLVACEGHAHDAVLGSGRVGWRVLRPAAPAPGTERLTAALRAVADAWIGD